MSFERRPWDAAADAAFDDFLIEPGQRSEIIGEVDSGAATLWRITGAAWETWLITRLEHWPGGHREMVLEAVTGRHVVPILRKLFAHYRDAGVNSVRFATPHPEGVAARLVAPLGMQRAETIFRVNFDE